MLFVYTGTDYQKSNKVAEQLVVGLQAKQPDAELVTIQTDNIDELISQLSALANDQGLFFAKSIVSMGRLLPDKDIEKALKSLIPTLSESPSVFIWSEPDLNKTWIKLLEKHDSKVTVSGVSAGKGYDASVFASAKALLAGDRQKLWLEIKSLQENGVDPENIFGTLWWQVKTLIIAKSSKTAKEADMKPYSYNSAQKSPYTLERSRRLLSEMIAVQDRAKQHHGHGLAVELESFALNLKV